MVALAAAPVVISRTRRGRLWTSARAHGRGRGGESAHLEASAEKRSRQNERRCLVTVAKTMFCTLLLCSFSLVGNAQFQQHSFGASSCTTTGSGPGNAAACGSLATSCIATGSGPGNDAACGGMATYCVVTGSGPGNDAACGGMATSCAVTGSGPDNDAACGGIATSCTITGAGPGNDAACGGRDGLD